MKAIINGEPREAEDGISVSKLLDDLRLTGKLVVVEMNQRALFPREREATITPDNARIEIVTLAAGG